MLIRIISSLLVWGSLCLGAVSASTAYLPSLASVPVPPADDTEGVALTLGGPIGRVVGEDGAVAPLANRGDTLSKELLDRIAAANEAALARNAELEQQGAPSSDRLPVIDRVKVKEFSFGRWEEKLLFLLSAVGLLGGAGLARLDAARSVAAARAGGTGEDGEAIAPARPKALLVTAHERVHALVEAAATTSDPEARRAAIIEELDAVRGDCLEPFVGLRASIVAAVGMTGYARVMDPFAATERAFNRAWSAAADGYPVESEESLARGLGLLAEAVERAPE